MTTTPTWLPSDEHQTGPSGLLIYSDYLQYRQYSSIILMYILVTMKVLAVKVHWVPQDLARILFTNGGKATKVKILMSAYKDNQENINNSSSSKGKKSVWEKIFGFFTEPCKTAGIGSSRSLTQIKKWWALLKRYKAIVDNSKKTVQGREYF